MPARSLCLLRENCWQSYESPHSNGLVVKEQKWLKTKGRNSWGWMSDDKCISTRWHFHHHLIDHLGDILNCGLCECVCVCVSYAESGRWKQLLNTHTFGHWMNISAFSDRLRPRQRCCCCCCCFSRPNFCHFVLFIGEVEYESPLDERPRYSMS